MAVQAYRIFVRPLSFEDTALQCFRRTVIQFCIVGCAQGYKKYWRIEKAMQRLLKFRITKVVPDEAP